MGVVLLVKATDPVVTRAAATAANNTERVFPYTSYVSGGMCTSLSIRCALQLRITGHDIYEERTHPRSFNKSPSNCFIDHPQSPHPPPVDSLCKTSRIYRKFSRFTASIPFFSLLVHHLPVMFPFH